MLNGYKNPKILSSEFYKLDNQLQTRINFWNQYGQNSIGYGEVLKSLLLDKYENMIDIGCGNARYSSTFLNNVVREATFLDLSEDMLTSTQKNVANIDAKPSVIFYHQENFLTAKLEKNYYDLVVAMHVLQHVDDIYAGLEKLKEILADNGTVLITTYNNTLSDCLNQKHYYLLKELEFPTRMLDKKMYLTFSGNHARKKLSEVFNTFEEMHYKNDAIVDNVEDLMTYYKSSMMYRMSEGRQSKDISEQQWQKLETRMYQELSKEIALSGKITVEGRVQIFKVCK
ncbi:UNVERIFIED_CONTAM: methyltransferase [Streptococcus canis]|uniref:class I SAM-dependent methyltransferase n=1 Tax=Streptococcus TaxID=1301 RepID=UPI001E403B43|nr:class I SAM-dependent methyltransferase [Streptococcus equi]GMX36360.1 hypothetical protein SpKU43_14380 [Streptococcus canis]MCD3371431.1 class I SAM-dependent methyltransferase [Streptococcus equi subsp. zooepidemicus]GMX38897.1 hypothetical protein ScKU71_01200 [Streptococcus canis]HEL0578812.1 methyltransferase [Streptococcus equi subsp. zooepidemicus]HEL0795650.1 methyltransferase [Streptococcus equi subsp. zooepidemicus]